VNERARLLGWPTWIGVVVRDLEGQRRFWGDLLGVPEAASGPDFVHWDLGQGRSFELIERSQAPEYDRPRFQVGFAVEDIGAARDELIRRGVEPVTDIVRSDQSSWAYFRDPEGNVFEITQRSGG
jgi:catechol 2,3-dioxygenase-like lactoylglutathione lyase family enzyme